MITLNGLHCTWKYLFYLEAWPSDWLDRFLLEWRRCWIRPRSWACASWSSSGPSPSPGYCSRTKRRRKSRGGWHRCRWSHRWSKVEKQNNTNKLLKENRKTKQKQKKQGGLRQHQWSHQSLSTNKRQMIPIIIFKGFMCLLGRKDSFRQWLR